VLHALLLFLLLTLVLSWLSLSLNYSVSDFLEIDVLEKCLQRDYKAIVAEWEGCELSEPHRLVDSSEIYYPPHRGDYLALTSTYFKDGSLDRQDVYLMYPR
jgi:hypothetical protein